MAAEKNVALRKRQQIQSANRNMFMWVAIAAAIVGVSAVLSVSLVQRLLFNQKVIDKKSETATTLRDNLANVEKLKENVRVRNTNPALIATPRVDDREPISVVLDALPGHPNSSALGASLQQNLLTMPGVDIDGLVVDAVASDPQRKSSLLKSSKAPVNQITFQFSLSASSKRLEDMDKVLKKIERSIRVIDITSLVIEQQNDQVTMSAEGRAFYEPEQKVGLTQAVVKP